LAFQKIHLYLFAAVAFLPPVFHNTRTAKGPTYHSAAHSQRTYTTPKVKLGAQPESNTRCIPEKLASGHFLFTSTTVDYIHGTIMKWQRGKGQTPAGPGTLDTNTVRSSRRFDPWQCGEERRGPSGGLQAVLIAPHRRPSWGCFSRPSSPVAPARAAARLAHPTESTTQGTHATVGGQHGEVGFGEG
jgi:hypothetical protein